MMSNLIKNGQIIADDWTLVTLPPPDESTVRKQAGKVVIFKVTGEAAATPEQINTTVIPATGKIIVPLSLWQAREPGIGCPRSQRRCWYLAGKL